MELRFWKNTPETAEIPEDDGYHPLLSSRELLEQSGQPIHLFVDSMEGPLPIYDRQKAAARALAHLQRIQREES